MTGKTVNLLFAATSDYLSMAVVTAVSAKANLNKDDKLKIYFLYADIVKNISDKERKNIFEYAIATLNEHEIEYEFIDVKDKMYLLDGQNTGLWGEAISMTHYIFMLAPEILKDIDKVIYLDTDMIVNCDLSEVYNIDLGNHLIAMGAPRGAEDMGDDVCNGGFVFLNLDLWRKENTLPVFLEFGRNLPKSDFCAQNLLHQYFTLNHRDRLLHLDKTYNIFPQLFPEIKIEDIKILHFTGWDNIKPWFDMEGKQRAGFLWWKYAKMTTFYEQFLLKNVVKNTHKHIEYKPLERIFSIKNFGELKIITVLGFKIKRKRGSKKCQKTY